MGPAKGVAGGVWRAHNFIYNTSRSSPMLMQRTNESAKKKIFSRLLWVDKPLFTNSLLMSVFIFFFQIFKSFYSWNKEHFIFEHLRKILQPGGGIFLLPYKWCITYANVFCFRVFYWNYLELDPKLYFFWKAHFVHFQMRCSSLHFCKYLLRYKIKQFIHSNWSVFSLLKMS